MGAGGLLCLHTGRRCHRCLQLNPKGSSCCKSPFSLPGAAAAHQHPFGCKTGGCTCRLVLLLGELRRREEPEMGGKKAFGEPRRETMWVWAQAVLLPATLQPNTKPGRLRAPSLPNGPSSWVPFSPRLSKESEVSAQAASQRDSIHCRWIYST